MKSCTGLLVGMLAVLLLFVVLTPNDKEGDTQSKTSKVKYERIRAINEYVILDLSEHGVTKLNLWPHPTDRSKPKTTALHGQTVLVKRFAVMTDGSTYVEIEANGKKGWCLSDWVGIDNNFQ